MRPARHAAAGVIHAALAGVGSLAPAQRPFSDSLGPQRPFSDSLGPQRPFSDSLGPQRPFSDSLGLTYGRN